MGFTWSGDTHKNGTKILQADESTHRRSLFDSRDRTGGLVKSANGYESFHGLVHFDKSDKNYATSMDRVLLVSNSTNVTNATVVTGSNAANITHPIVEIALYNSVVWSITNANYPVYVKSSLLNTNLDFDYGAFRNLDDVLVRSTMVLTSFIFTFAEPGTYVFRISSDPNQITIVKVLGANDAALSSSVFSVMSDASITKLGITSTDDIVVEPDWTLVAGPKHEHKHEHKHKHKHKTQTPHKTNMNTSTNTNLLLLSLPH
jgi:hypothetical protein